MHLLVPHISPIVVHLCLYVFSYYCAFVEVVAFGVEVLLAVWAFELFVGFPDVHSEAAKEIEMEEAVVLSVCAFVAW